MCAERRDARAQVVIEPALAPTNHAGLFLAAAILVMAFLALRTRPANGRPLQSLERIAVYLGETSFAVYLCHWFVLMLWGAWSRRMSLGWSANPILAAVLIAAVVQCLASVLHQTVGEPARRLIRSSARRPSPPSQTYAVGASR